MIEWIKYDEEDSPRLNTVFLVNANIELGIMFKSIQSYQCTAIKKGTGWFDILTDEWVPNVTHYAKINHPNP